MLLKLFLYFIEYIFRWHVQPGLDRGARGRRHSWSLHQLRQVAETHEQTIQTFYCVIVCGATWVAREMQMMRIGENNIHAVCLQNQSQQFIAIHSDFSYGYILFFHTYRTVVEWGYDSWTKFIKGKEDKGLRWFKLLRSKWFFIRWSIGGCGKVILNSDVTITPRYQCYTLMYFKLEARDKVRVAGWTHKTFYAATHTTLLQTSSNLACQETLDF